MKESVVSGFEETEGCHGITMNLNFFLSHPALAGHTVELCRVILNDPSLSSTEDPSHSTKLFLAKLLCFLGQKKKKKIIRYKTDLLQKKKY